MTDSLNGGSTTYDVVKGKAVPFEAWTGPWASKGLRPPEILNSRHMRVLRLSALRTSRLPPPKEVF